ncbi:MAG: T9SS type A sorting domain-containing protein [Bacteroidia bacterium]|nr:MAG: T9SS type A sorting domain-containing protein [Bacteroidia bacterium]
MVILAAENPPMKAIYPFLLLLLLSFGLLAQFAGSDIPLVVIEPNGGFPIPDEPKIKATMKIIDHGQGGWNAPSDPGNIYSGEIGIEIRGAYSASLPQKPYGFETRNPDGSNLNVSLLGLPAENDWILLANYNDKSFLRNALAGHLFRRMGHYAPRTRHCEVLVNGDYQGIYVLTEKIKRDNNRVDIAKLETTENTGDELTGGYIIKTDYYGAEDSWVSNFPPATRPEKRVHHVYVYPDPYDITEAQKDYIQSYMNSFEEALHGPDFTDWATGYKAYIDVNSFRDYFILSELTRNVDAYKKSRFLYKDKESKGGRLHSGPPWDYDWAWKDIWDCYMFANTDGSGWAYQVNDCDVWPTPPVYMTRLLQDEYFANKIKRRYVDLRKGPLSNGSIFFYIDSVSTYLSEAQKRHYDKWDILGENVGAPEVGYIPTNFAGEMSKFKNWISTRLAWLDANMPGDENGPLQIDEYPGALFRMFPNPASELVYIESDTPIEDVEIYSISGRKVYQNPSPSGYSVVVDIQDLPSGLYLVKIALQSGEVISQKLVVR